MEFSLPQKIITIISMLNYHGYSAHVVGGCVRDMILNKEPKDWDITTNALPEEVKRIFPTTYDTGLKHGTVTVSHEGMSVEITTWRKETHYTDHRRPDQVFFSSALLEDLERRDFTMNAIAYHPKDGLTDPFYGVEDIRKRLIRCVGNPFKRFSEDALRMLRAIRFAAQLNFSIDSRTLEAIIKLSGDLKYVSRERVNAELNKILESNDAKKIALLWDTKLYEDIFPGIDALPPTFLEISSRLGSQKKTLFGVESEVNTPKKADLLGLLFYLAFGSNSRQHAVLLLRRLKYDNVTLRYARDLVTALDELNVASQRNIRKMTCQYGRDITQTALSIMVLSGRLEAGSIGQAAESDSIIPDIPSSCLIEAGFLGKEIGYAFQVLCLCLFERPQLNDRETLLLLVKDIRNKNFMKP